MRDYIIGLLVFVNQKSKLIFRYAHLVSFSFVAHRPPEKWSAFKQFFLMFQESSASFRVEYLFVTNLDMKERKKQLP